MLTININEQQITHKKELKILFLISTCHKQISMIKRHPPAYILELHIQFFCTDIMDKNIELILKGVLKPRKTKH